MNALEEYYNKFNEDKRLDSRHGQVEFITSMKYIHHYLDKIIKWRQCRRDEIRILDIGAATGRYSVPLAEEGYDVTAVEPVKHNISRLRLKTSLVHAYQADARDMSRFKDGSFDLTLVFGPLYHLLTEEQQLQALLEAKRVTKMDGVLMAAYVMNEYSVLTYAFKECHIREALQEGMLDAAYHCTEKANPLYHMVRLEDMERLNRQAGLKRIQVVASDGAANYMRRELNQLDEEEFLEYIRYHLATCERMDLMGASGHTLDVLQKEQQTDKRP